MEFGEEDMVRMGGNTLKGAREPLEEVEEGLEYGFDGGPAKFD